MNSKSDEKTIESERPRDEPTGTVLRLVPRVERERAATPTESPARHSIRKEVKRPTSAGDDDDPGPTAA